MQIIEAKKQV